MILHGIDDSGACTCQGATRGCKRGKHPRFEKWIEEATSDPLEIEMLFRLFPISNLGRLVRADEWIFDVDDPEAFSDAERQLGPMPTTVTVLTGTGRGRKQLSFRRSEEDLVGKPIWGEIKWNGLVVVPPSMTANEYAYATGCSPAEVGSAECPAAWLEALRRPDRHSAYPEIPETSVCWSEDLGELLLDRALSESREGNRHRTNLELSLQLRDNRAPKADAVALVEAFADEVEHDGDHPFDRSEARQTLDGVYGTPARDPWASSSLAPPATSAIVGTVSVWELVNEEPSEEPSLLGDGILVRATVNHLAGEGGVGKTSLAVQLGLCLASKTSFLGMDVKEAVSVLYLLAEGNRYKFAERLKRAADTLEIDLQGLPVSLLAAGEKVPQLSDPAFRRLIEDTKAGVVILDTHGYFHGGEDNSRSDWKQQVVKPLRELALLPAQPAFILLDHLTKENLKFNRRGGSLRTRIVGAGNKRDDSDSVFILHWPDGELDPLRVLYFDKLKNQEPLPPSDLHFDLPTGTFRRQPRSVSAVIAQEERRLQALEEVVSEEMDTATIVRQLKRRLSLKQSSAEKLIKLGSDEDRIKKIRKGVYGPTTASPEEDRIEPTESRREGKVDPYDP